MSSSRRKRILFIGEAVTLAHVARPFALASMLDPGQYDIHVAWDARYDRLLGQVPFTRWPLSSIESRTFAEALRHGRPIFDRDTLDAYIRADLQLLGQVQPDVVVGDLRLSLSASARLAGVPYLAIANAYWSPHAKVRLPAPVHLVSQLLGLRAAEHLINAIWPLVRRHHARPLDQARRAHGLAPLLRDGFHTYVDADHVLYADVPELVPMGPLPPTHHFVGPIPFSVAAPLPPFWEQLPPERPIVYVNLGSSGAGETLPRIVEGLSGLPVSIVAATGGRTIEHSGDQIWCAEFLPGDLLAARSSVVVCNGGSGAAHQALLAGVPVLGVPQNLDQLLNMQTVVRAGAGIEVRSDRVTATRVRASAETLLADASYRARAEQIGGILRRCSARERLEAVLSEVLADARQRAA